MKIRVTLNSSEQPRTFELQGRLGWTMAQLADAGLHGVTPIERPAPRWSGYVHNLRSMGKRPTSQSDHRMRPPSKTTRLFIVRSNRINGSKRCR